MALAIYTDAEQAAWRTTTAFLRERIRALAIARRPNKLRTRKGEREQWLLASERKELRAHYLLYGLIRGKTWQQIESGHEEPVAWMRPHVRLLWNQLVVGGYIVPAPECIAEWLS